MPFVWSPVRAVPEVRLRCVRTLSGRQRRWIQLFFEGRCSASLEAGAKLTFVAAQRQQSIMSMSKLREPVAVTKTGKRQLRQSATP